MHRRVFPMLSKGFKWENTSASHHASVGKLNLEILCVYFCESRLIPIIMWLFLYRDNIWSVWIPFLVTAHGTLHPVLHEVNFTAKLFFYLFCQTVYCNHSSSYFTWNEFHSNSVKSKCLLQSCWTHCIHSGTIQRRNIFKQDVWEIATLLSSISGLTSQKQTEGSH